MSSGTDSLPTENGGSFLPRDAYAVIYHPERGFDIHLPHAVFEQDAELPDAATALLACATRIANDPSFLRAQVEWIKKQNDHPSR